MHRLQHLFLTHEQMFFCESVKVFETENVLPDGLETPPFGFMPNALTIWAVRAMFFFHVYILSHFSFALSHSLVILLFYIHLIPTLFLTWIPNILSAISESCSHTLSSHSCFSHDLSLLASLLFDPFIYIPLLSVYMMNFPKLIIIW